MPLGCKGKEQIKLFNKDVFGKPNVSSKHRMSSDIYQVPILWEVWILLHLYSYVSYLPSTQG
jgi:hypothetical protein